MVEGAGGMIGWTRRMDEEHAAARRRARRWKAHMRRKYNMPDDLAGLRDEFCMELLRRVEPELVPKALVDFGHWPIETRRPTLRCRLLGCSASGPCDYEPYCTECRGRCRRCRQPVVAPARVVVR